MIRTFLVVLCGLLVAPTAAMADGWRPTVKEKDWQRFMPDEIRPGLSLKVMGSHYVRCVNSVPIKRDGISLRPGEQCYLNDESRIQILAIFTEDKIEVALAVVGKPKSMGCLSGALFFMKVSEIREMLQEEAQKAALRWRESLLVERLLKEKGIDPRVFGTAGTKRKGK